MTIKEQHFLLTGFQNDLLSDIQEGGFVLLKLLVKNGKFVPWEGVQA
jgi:hypothetical protein